MGRTLFVLCIGLVLAGCRTSPVDPPLVVPADARAMGIVDALERYDEADLVMVHGMCHTTAAWPERRHVLLAEATGLVPTVPLKAVSGDDEPSLRVWRGSLEGEDRRLHVEYVVWSGFTEGPKQALCYDAEDPYGSVRGSLTGTLKATLLNDCLADAVAYLGPAGDGLRAAMKERVCKTFGGRFVDDRCSLAAPTDSSRPRLFLSESLGSKILLDGIEAVRADVDRAPASLASIERAAFEDELARAVTFVMASNQVPLLGIATADAAASEAVARDGGLTPFAPFAAAKEAARSRARVMAPEAGRAMTELAAIPLTIVAISDPNDLLSYTLGGSAVVRDGPDLKVVDVEVSNGPVWFGLSPDPLQAHTGYETNPDFLGVALHGLGEADEPRSVVASAHLPARDTSTACELSRALEPSG